MVGLIDRSVAPVAGGRVDRRRVFVSSRLPVTRLEQLFSTTDATRDHARALRAIH